MLSNTLKRFLRSSFFVLVILSMLIVSVQAADKKGSLPSEPTTMESLMGKNPYKTVSKMEDIAKLDTFTKAKATKQTIQALKEKAKKLGGKLDVIVNMLDNDYSTELPKDKKGLEDTKDKVKKNLDDKISKKGYLKDHKVEKLSLTPTLATTMSEGDLDDLAKDIEKSDNVIADIGENIPLKAQMSDIIPLVGANGLVNVGGTNTNFNGTGQIVAVIDDGVNYDNIMVSNKNTGSYCVIPSYTNTQSFCPANNEDGTTVDTEDPFGANQCNFTDPVTNSRPCSHGTAIAAAAIGTSVQNNVNDANFRGVAPGATFYPIQVSYLDFDSARCTAAGSTTTPCFKTDFMTFQKALQRIYDLATTDPAYQNKFAAVNFSYGTSQTYNGFCDMDPSFSGANTVIKNLRKINIPVVVSAGNSSTTTGGNTTAISSPACLSSVIAVAPSSTKALPEYNITAADQMPGYAFNNQNVKLLAPDLTNIYLSDAPGEGFSSVLKQATPQGSSISAAVVSGAFAQLKQAKPTATLEEMLNALQKTGKPIADTRYGNTKKLVKPRIQIDKAIDFLLNNTAGSTVFWYNSTSATSAWWDISKSGTVTNSSNYSQNVSVTGPGTSGSALLSVNTGGSLYGSPYPKGFKVGNIADFNGDGVNDIDWIPTWARIPDIRSFYMVGCYPNSCYGYNAYESIYPTTYGSNGWNISSCTILPNCDVSSAQSYFWYLNTATGTQAPNTLLKSTYNNPTAIRDYWNTPIASDLNRDGIADLLFRGNDNPFKGNISNTFDTRDLSANAGLLNIWYMGANGQPTSFGQINATVADTKWQITALADFNGDGNKDILWRNDTTGETLIWQLDSSSRFVQGKYLPTVTGWKLEGVADYDLDGKPELVWDEQGSSTNQVHWSINSDFTYGPGAQTSKPTNATFTDYRGSYDVNGDGIDDKVWQVSGQPTIQIMDHGGLITTTWNTLPNPTSAWMIGKNKLK